MKYLFLPVALGLLLATFYSKKEKQYRSEKAEKTAKSDWLINQRVYPFGAPDYSAYQQSVQWLRNEQSTMRSSFLQAWQYAGPENLGGRMVDVESLPNDVQTIYVSAASGGIFKTTNGGNTWTPIFDNSPSLSIGDLAIAPSNTNILYCGTGEANAGGGSLTYDGSGIFKSTDAGATWNYSGLDLTRNTGRIAIDPQNPDRVYAATMGDLFGNNPDRGLYRTTDGGVSWQNVLFADDSTGAIDVVINPIHPDTVYACLWTRVRRPDRRQYGGPASGIYRSYDGGDTWNKLVNGLPSYSLGRIGIDISQSQPNILYAVVEDSTGGGGIILRSSNFGDSWANVTNDYTPNAFSYWYGRIKIDPTNSNTVYAIDFDLWKTTDGGQDWDIITPYHVDQHEIYINPFNPDLLYEANDGGFFTSTDGGNNWTMNQKLPVMQFYTCEVNEQNPLSLYGGSQDNGTNTTLAGGINDWGNIWGGDGFVVLVDPVDTTRVYAEYQYAGLNVGTDGVDPDDRTNWNTPYVFNPRNSNTLYLGTEALYKSTDNGDNWYPLSGDLTNGSLAAAYPIVFATITTVAVAPTDTSVIYVGTDDGNIQMTTNEGGSWNLVSSSLPVRWVTHLEVDPRDAMSVYVSLSGYRYHENMSHVYHSADGGANWTDIGFNLPDVPCNDIIIDTAFSTLYLATDIGVFYSYIGNNTWSILGTELPVVPVCDLRLHMPSHTLVAATYGRSMYKFDLNILTSIDYEVTPVPFSFFVAENPVSESLSLIVYADKAASTHISLYDLSGNQVMPPQTITLHAGNNTFRKNISSYTVAAGIYFVQVCRGNYRQTKKICVVRN